MDQAVAQCILRQVGRHVNGPSQSENLCGCQHAVSYEYTWSTFLQTGDLPRVVDVHNDPWSDAAVDLHEIDCQPLPLRAAWGVVNIGGQVDDVGWTHVSTVEEVLAGSTGIVWHLQYTQIDCDNTRTRKEATVLHPSGNNR